VTDPAFGLRYTVFEAQASAAWPGVVAAAQRAEADGFRSFWLMDHFIAMVSHGSAANDPFLDAWTTLPALAPVTRTLRLGVHVSPVGFRNPTILARQAGTLDVISGGRLDFGFGAGGFRPEYEQYGVDFPPLPSTRIAQMEEALDLIIALWTQPLTTFQGDNYRAIDAVLEPKPIQQPYPPILIGGVGEKRILRAVARFGAACNLFGPPEEFRRVREVLRRHCEAVGRDESTIRKTTYDVVLCAPTEAAVREKATRLGLAQAPWKTLIGTPAGLRDLVAAYAEEGADELLIEFFRNDQESYELFAGEVMPSFRTAASSAH
jgi:alkanesulfonate monooxygenase SsuD/methylene tetrahydromethanopterin reductase-like flavin-dependent oxidoreductase (luciferase family)